MDSYTTQNGEVIDFKALREECPDQLRWIAVDLSESSSWMGFQSRCGYRVAQYTQRKLGMENWQSHPLYKLKIDLMGQLGVLNKEMSGTNTASFLEFHWIVTSNETSL